MHADGDWLAVEGVLNKDMATLGEYLQTWTLKLSTTKTVSAAFHLNSKEAKRELKVNFNNETLPFCSEPKYLGVTLDSPGPFDCRVLHSCLVPQCSYPPHWPNHQQRLANCDWMPASNTSGQPSNPRRHPTCWASSQRSHTISRTPCHGAWTPAPLSTDRPPGAAAWCLKSRHPFVPTAQQLISFSDNNNTCAAQWADHQWNAVWADNPTRLRTLIPDTGTHTPGITLCWVRVAVSTWNIFPDFGI